MHLVDLHSHVLPALDDGSPDMATSLAMLRTLAELGFARVTATPHQKAAQFLPAWADVTRARDQVRAALADAGMALELGLAAENYWDEVFFARQKTAGFPCYDDGGAFLFEIPPEEVPAHLEDTLFHLHAKGHLPVMAHPERCLPFWKDADRLARLAQGCALLVDLGAVAGYHGRPEARAARRLLADRIAHAAATDVHAPEDVRAAAAGIAWIKKKLGEDAVKRLLDDNPRRILAGELPEA